MDEKRHPAYVNLRRDEEMTKWEAIKDKIRYLVEETVRQEENTRKISLHNATQSTVEKYIDTINRKTEELECNKNRLYYNIDKIPDVFIPYEDKEEAIKILERVGVSYCKSGYSRVYAWTKEQEVQ